MQIKESLAIGAISSFFGRRMGHINIHDLITSLGLKAPYGSKQKRIDYILRQLFPSNKEDFVLFLNMIVDNHDLAIEDKFQLNQFLRILGYAIVNDQIKTAEKTEIIYPEPRPFDAFKDIEKIILTAKKEIKIIDPYVDESLFPLYFSNVEPQVDIRIITKNINKRFEAVATKFKEQKNNFEVKIAQGIHDRYIIIDNRAWMLGQSIKDAGNKPLTIIEFRDSSTLLALFSKLWENSMAFL